MTQPGQVSSARQFLVKVEGIEGYWSQKTGGEVAAEVGKAYDGGALKPDLVPGVPGAENITVTRPYKVTRDAELGRRLKPLVAAFSATISITPTDANMVAVGSPEVYPNAMLTRVRMPEVDASSGDGSTIELEFAVGDYR